MYYKYPRTYHVNWSPGTTSDDKILHDLTPFRGIKMIGTLKMDGENTNLYSDHIHARSIDSKDHESRSWIKGLWGSIRHQIPEEWRICGENLYAKHSLEYNNLETYFQVFSIWNELNECLSWDHTKMISESLGLKTVDEIGGPFYFDEILMKSMTNSLDTTKNEGIVFRNVESFNYDTFANNVCKWVRKNHITTDEHWMFQKIIPNKLRSYGDETTSQAVEKTI